MPDFGINGTKEVTAPVVVSLFILSRMAQIIFDKGLELRMYRTQSVNAFPACLKFVDVC